MKLHLRQRKQTKKGKISLYIEYYKGTAVNSTTKKAKVLRDYEYLNLYLFDKPKTPSDKQHNKDMLRLAESIKAKRELDIINGIYGFNNQSKQSVNFIKFFESLKEKRIDSHGNYGNWDSALKHFRFFAGEQITFQEIDRFFCERFKDYLLKSAKKRNGGLLSKSSASSYFNKFRAVLKEAVKQQIINYNPSVDIPSIKIPERETVFLTIDEIRMIAKTDCRYPVLKRAFLFGCFTGLRWSDINKLRWGNVKQIGDKMRVVFNQHKTKGLQYQDLNDQARALMGEVGSPDDLVFSGLKYSSYMNVELTKWMLKSRITKDITFHCSRHSFAMMLIKMGVDIYTVSKLLGHSEIKTTQLYAKILDEKKREAVDKLPSIEL